MKYVVVLLLAGCSSSPVYKDCLSQVRDPKLPAQMENYIKTDQGMVEDREFCRAVTRAYD